MNAPDYPTPWQRKTLWSALTAVAVVTIGAIIVGIIWLTSRVLGFLQPILIPFAIAGVLAYLLDPVVSRIVSWGTSRHRAVFAVFAIVSILFAGVLLWVVPAISEQSVNLARRVPGYTQRAKTQVIHLAQVAREKYGIALLPDWEKPAEPKPSPADLKNVPPSPMPDSAGDSPAEAALNQTDTAAGLDQPIDLQHLLSGDWLQSTLLTLGKKLWDFIRSSVGGFLGVLGFLLSMVIVPVYLYYFLIESRNISSGWQDYLPLRASAFKDEVVATLNEINGYLIAFFRGQLVVSLINGTATGIGLVAVGLDFGLLIGLLLCVLGLIPYLGIILCWIPAVIIAAVQGGFGTWIPSDPWWLFPLVVTSIFVVVQQIDGLFITPKVVGESVGLHPMTVIVSVFIWSLLMGGLLGAILAVPLTATLKVLLRHFVWERRFRAQPPPESVTEETFALRQALEREEGEPVFNR
jgi:predicted PurR-regulated permease PerM